MKHKRLVTHQSVHESDNTSTYESYVDVHGENSLANPDLLADIDDNTIWGRGNKPELAELFIERFTDENGKFPMLSDQENDVLSIYTQTGSVTTVCKQLKLSRSSCNTYLARIRRKFKRLMLTLNY